MPISAAARVWRRRETARGGDSGGSFPSLSRRSSNAQAHTTTWPLPLLLALPPAVPHTQNTKKTQEKTKPQSRADAGAPSLTHTHTHTPNPKQKNQPNNQTKPKVATLDSNEQRFLEATMAYGRGAPIMADADYDALKAELRAKASVVTAEGPRCSIRTKKMYSDANPDYLRMTLLNLPAATVVLGLLFGLDDLTGFEITSLLELPPPFGILALWGVLLPAVFVVATSLTNLVLKDALVLRAPCPNCGSENVSYFGDILTVPGNRGVNVIECTGCRADISFDLNKRIVVVDKTPEEKAEAAAALAAKKAASAAKKAAAAAKKAAAQQDQA